MIPQESPAAHSNPAGLLTHVIQHTCGFWPLNRRCAPSLNRCPPPLQFLSLAWNNAYMEYSFQFSTSKNRNPLSHLRDDVVEAEGVQQLPRATALTRGTA